MNRYHIKAVLVFAFLTIFTQGVNAKSSVWKVSKGNNYFYLGGTIHLLNKADHPLPKEFMSAYQDSEKLIFEVDIGKSSTIEAQRQFMAAMMNPTGKTLSESLKPSTYSNLKAYLERKSIPAETFVNFAPWGVALTLSVMEYQQLGMQAEYGVDQYFYNLAVADKKAVGSLETLEQQISYLKSMGKIEPNLFITYTLRDLKELPKFANGMTKNWRKGNLNYFTDNTMLAQSKVEFPGLYDTLLTERNNNWIPQLIGLVKNKTKEFVLVGTMHLSDTDGLINQLKIAGFKVEQL